MRNSLTSRYSFLMAMALVFLFSNSKPVLADQDQDRKAKSLAAYAMGVVYDMEGSTDNAIAEFKRSASYQDNYAVHLRLGTAYARANKMGEAILEFEKALQYDQENVQAHYLLALIYSSQKNYDKAAENYEAILKTFSKVEPQNAEIYGYLGQLYYAKKEYDKAINQFEKILIVEKDNSDVMYVLGALYLEVKDRPKAREMFSQCIDYAPDHDGCLNSLGYMDGEDGVQLDEAQALVERAVAIDPDNGAYLDSLGWIYFKQGKNDKALEILNKADQQMKDPEIFDHLGDVYFKMNQLDNARKYWGLSLQLRPGQEDVEKKLKSIK